MNDEERRHGLSRLLAETARAHHEATGGPNSDWPGWYAAYLEERIDEFVGFSPTVATIRSWMVECDELQRAEDPDGRWPPFYAKHILDNYAAG